MYSLKEILTGYRIEYQKIKNELDKLEINIKILDNNIRKCLPLLANDKELSLYFIDGKRNIMDTFILIKEELGIISYDLENLEWDKTIDLVYHFENNNRGYHILIQYINEFNNKVLNILNQKYTKYIKGQFIGINNELLTLDYNILSLENDQKEFIYYPNPDIYSLSSLNKDKTKELELILDSKFDKEQFNLYQREFIENNKGKELILKK